MSKYVVSAALISVLLTLPLYGEAYLLRLGTLACMYAVLSASWNLVGGLAGYPSFATAAFFGLGAYTGGLLVAQGVNLGLAVAGAGLLTFAFALAFGYLLLRLKGHYFAIASLAVVEVLREIANTSVDLTGGGMGLNIPRSGSLSVVAEAQMMFLWMWALLVGTVASCFIVERSRLGLGLTCIRQAEGAAETIGINTTLYKSLAFGLSGLGVAMAGALYANWVNYIEPGDVFDILYSIKPIVMTLIGGVGTTLGAIAGAFLYVAAEEVIWRSYLQFSTGLLGLLVVVLLLFVPGGLASLRWFRGRV